MLAESLITFVIASALLSIAPGPDNIFVLTQSALYGWKSGVLITLGLCTGLLIHTAAVVFGVAAILQTSETAFTLLKAAGALYLLYLAWQVFRASAQSLEVAGSNLLSMAALYWRGIFMNVTNPKVSIFFLAFLPQFVEPDAGSVTIQVIILGAVFICVALLVFSAIALLSGSLGNRLRKSPRIQHYLNIVAGMVFIGLALKLLLSTTGS